jgi:hypothetical protein
MNQSYDTYFPVDPDFGAGRPWAKDRSRSPLKGHYSDASPQEVHKYLVYLQEGIDLAAQWEKLLETRDPTRSRSRYAEAKASRRSLTRYKGIVERHLWERQLRAERVHSTRPEEGLAPDEAAPEGYEERAVVLTLNITLNVRAPKGEPAGPEAYQALYDIATHVTVNLDDWDLDAGTVTDV